MATAEHLETHLYFDHCLQAKPNGRDLKSYKEAGFSVNVVNNLCLSMLNMHNVVLACLLACLLNFSSC